MSESDPQPGWRGARRRPSTRFTDPKSSWIWNHDRTEGKVPTTSAADRASLLASKAAKRLQGEKDSGTKLREALELLQSAVKEIQELIGESELLTNQAGTQQSPAEADELNAEELERAKHGRRGNKGSGGPSAVRPGSSSRTALHAGASKRRRVNEDWEGEGTSSSSLASVPISTAAVSTSGSGLSSMRSAGSRQQPADAVEAHRMGAFESSADSSSSGITPPSTTSKASAEGPSTTKFAPENIIAAIFPQDLESYEWRSAALSLVEQSLPLEVLLNPRAHLSKLSYRNFRQQWEKEQGAAARTELPDPTS